MISNPLLPAVTSNVALLCMSWRAPDVPEGPRCPGGPPGAGRGERGRQGERDEILDLGTLLAKAAVEESPVDLTGVALHVEACLVLAVNETEGLLRVYGHARVCA